MKTKNKPKRRHGEGCVQAVGIYCCTLFQNLPGIIYRKFLKENNRMQFFTDMLQPMTGFTVDELKVGAGDECSIETLILPEDRPKVADAVKYAIAHNQPFEVEYRIKSKGEEVRYFWERGIPIFGTDENLHYDKDPLYIDGVIFDITKRKKAEEEVIQCRQHIEHMLNDRTAQLVSANEQLERQIYGRRQAEVETTMSRARLQHLLLSSPAVIYSCTISGDFGTTSISGNVKTQLGYESWEFVRNPRFWNEHLHPEDKLHILNDLSQVLHKDRHTIEYRFRHKDGSYRWIRDELNLVRDPNGNPLEIVGCMLDISNRKLAEDKTRIAYTELNQIFNAAVDGMTVIDKEFRVFRVNDTFCRFFGVNREKVVGSRCYDVLNCSFYKDVSGCPLSLILKGDKERFECDLEIERSDGTGIPFVLTAVPLRGPDGELIGIVENFRDISGSKRMEESVRESEEKYLALVEQSKDGVVIIDGGGILRFVNKALAEMCGYTVEEVIGKPFIDFIAPDSRENTIQKYRSCLAGEYVSFYETRLVCNNGAIKDIEVSASPIHYQGETVVMVIIHDVTEHKRGEEELRKIQKLESLGVLAGGIAHDFNNLLAAIAGNLSVAQEYAQSGYNLSPILKETQNAIRQAKSLTQQLLTFAKGGSMLRKAACLSELIKNTAIFALSGSKTKCEFSLPDDLWWSEIDDGQIGQVINNLVINADQAMTGGGLIEISAENITVRAESSLPLKEGKYIKMSVKDHGNGIRREDLQKIFDPYFTTKQKGSGLGLAIAYSVIKKHEGHITVESGLGVGTSFYIYLPALERKTWWTVKDDAKNNAKEKILAGHGRVLFMDDQQIMRAMVGRMLTSLGYEVVFAGEGDEAVELYKKARESGRPFDVVILDLTIPGGMGGEEAVQKLHEIDPGVKAIVSSGYTNDPIMSEYREHGFSGVVAKPYEMKELSETLAHVIHEGEQFH